MNKTAAGRWWRRHGALVLMSALLLYDLWISAYPARVETVSGAYTQYDRYETRPRSEMGRSGVPSLFSRFESSYEKAIISLPYPLRW